MSNVPTNLIPTRISQLPEYVGSSTLGYMAYVLDGRTYKVQFSTIASVGAVPSSRVIATGNGLQGGGDLTQDRTISIISHGVGFAQLDFTGVVAGTYGGAATVPAFTVDDTGRVTAVTDTPIVLPNYVPSSRTVTAGAGLTGGGQLDNNITVSLNPSNATPQPLGAASAGTGLQAAREDHVHPAVDLTDTTETQGVLPLGRGGTGDALSPVVGAVIYADNDSLNQTVAGNAGQLLTSAGGSGAPFWQTLVAGTGITISQGAGTITIDTSGGGAGTVTSVSGTGTVNGITLTGTVTSSGSLTLGGTLSGVSLTTQVSGTLPVANGGTGATTLTSGYLVKGNDAAAASASVVYDDGANVGIGTASPSGKLSVTQASSATAAIQITATSGANPYIAFTDPLGTAGIAGGTSGTLLLRAGGATAANNKVYVLSSGNVGIGAANPLEKLTIGSGNILLSDTYSLVWGGTNNYITGANASNYIAIGTNAAERMRVTATGNVGIGTSTPQGPLHVVAGTDNTLLIRGPITYGTGATIYAVNDTNSTITPLEFAASGYYFAGGNIGIGTSSPGAKLDVLGVSLARTDASGGNSPLVARNDSSANNTTKSTGLLFQGVDTIGGGKSVGLVQCGPSDADYVTSYLAFYTRAADTLSERMRVTSDGQVAIGTTGGDYGRVWSLIANKNQNDTTSIGVINPNTGAAAVAAYSKITGTGNSFVDWQLLDNAGSPFDQYGYGSAVSHVRWVFGANERMRLTSAGDVGIGNAPSGTYKLEVTGATYSSSMVLGAALPVASGGTGQTTYTDGQLLIGNTVGNTLAKATLTAGSGISITNGNGSITITSLAGGGSVTSVSGTGTVNGLTLTGTVTSSGSLTLGGTLSGVSLTTQVSGTLPIANGGTGATTDAAARTALGATTLGANVFTITNPSAITFPRFNADNTVSALDAATFRTAIGAGGGSVTSVGGTGTVNGLTLTGTVTSSGSLTLGGTLSGVSLTTQVTGTLPVANGGTGATTAAAARTSLGATTLGANIFTITNPSAITFPRFNADNTMSALDAATFRTAIGAGTSSTTGTVTSVGGTGTVNGLTLTGTVTSTGNLTLGGTLSGVSLTTQVSGTLPIANGGTGATTAAAARTALGSTTVGDAVFIAANAAAGRTALAAAASGANTDITSLDQDVTITATGTIAADSIGYRGIPQNAQTASYTLALSDAGKHISNTSGGFVIPANGTVAFPIGTTIVLFNNSGTSQNVTITTDTLRLAGTATTGTRALAQYGLATCVKVTSTVWVISGAGLT